MFGLSSLYATARKIIFSNVYMSAPKHAFTRVKPPLRAVLRAPSSIGRRVVRHRPFSTAARREREQQAANGGTGPRKPLYSTRT
jgi:hypothetical protein